MRRVLYASILMCIAMLSLAVISAANAIVGTRSVDNIQNVDGFEGSIEDHLGSLPSLCEGMSEAIESRSGLGDLLLARGLIDEIPVPAATQLGTVGTVHCYSDDIEGKIAIVLLNESRETNIVIANDRVWANSVKSMTDDFGNHIFPQRHQFDVVSGTEASGEVINIDSIIQNTTDHGGN